MGWIATIYGTCLHLGETEHTTVDCIVSAAWSLGPDLSSSKDFLPGQPFIQSPQLAVFHQPNATTWHYQRRLLGELTALVPCNQWLFSVVGPDRIPWEPRITSSLFNCLDALCESAAEVTTFYFSVGGSPYVLTFSPFHCLPPSFQFPQLFLQTGLYTKMGWISKIYGICGHRVPLGKMISSHPLDFSEWNSWRSKSTLHQSMAMKKWWFD